MPEDAINSIVEAPQDVQFAAAVAAFGQKLRGGKYLNDWDFDAIGNLAQSAKGDDQFGYRAEFTQLVRLARSSSTMPSLEISEGTVTQ